MWQGKECILSEFLGHDFVSSFYTLKPKKKQKKNKNLKHVLKSIFPALHVHYIDR